MLTENCNESHSHSIDSIELILHKSRSTAFQSFQLATDLLSAQEVVQVASKVLELSLNKERKRQSI